MLIKIASVSFNVVQALGEVDETIFATLNPAIYFDVSAYPDIRSGWLRDPVTGTFSPDWTIELPEALDFLKQTSRDARNTMTLSSVEYDASEDALARLTSRIRAREERGDQATDTELWRLKDETFVDQSLAEDKALLVAAFEHIQACEAAYQTAVADVYTAIAAEDLAALTIAKNPNWPT